MPVETTAAVNALLNTLQVAILLALLRWVYGHRNGSLRERDVDRRRDERAP